MYRISIIFSRLKLKAAWSGGQIWATQKLILMSFWVEVEEAWVPNYYYLYSLNLERRVTLGS